eukprot:SAG11_NODE_8541_length_1003_cov_1.307522_1_plen_274_part_01
MPACAVAQAAGNAQTACSGSSCSDLGWTPRDLGGTELAVCGCTGESAGGCTSECPGQKTWADAAAFCVAAGARLCTCIDLFAHEAARGSGCDVDNDFAWTSTPCGDGRYYAAQSNAGDATTWASEVQCTAATETVAVRCCADVNVVPSANGCDTSQTLLFPDHLSARAAYCTAYTAPAPEPNLVCSEGVRSGVCSECACPACPAGSTLVVDASTTQGSDSGTCCEAEEEAEEAGDGGAGQQSTSGGGTPWRAFADTRSLCLNAAMLIGIIAAAY